MGSPPDPIIQSDVHDDAVRAIKFMAVKAAIFILVPLLAALIAVWWRFG
ncbi:MAG: phosphoribosylformylglycinamidine synthase-associated small membrane protein [Hyphomicrobiaceae bacterium]